MKQMPPAYQIIQAPEHKRPTLFGVLWTRFLVWLQDASWYRIRRTLCRLGCVVAVVTGFAAPQYLLGVLAASLSFHDALVPKAGICIVALLYGRAWYRFARRWQARIRAGGNQHTFEGVPIDELASYLLSSGRFTREDAMERLHLSQPKHKRIGDLLEQVGVLVRGEFNALQLQEISREQLVSILRAVAAKKASPLVFDPERGGWHERDSMATRFILDQERRRREEATALARSKARIERKEERLDQALEDVSHSPFVRRLISA